ncbi:MAG: hypothetical protein ACLPYS_10765 [Vulcanimicrobiaceae bacterium]
MTARHSLDARAQSAQLLGYWRDCLAEEAETLAAGERTAALPDVDLAALAAGHVPEPVANELFGQGASEALSVLVAVGRLASRRRAAASNRSEAVVPLWLPAQLERNGELRAGEEGRAPFLARAVLAPTGAAVSIGRLEDAAEFCARAPAAFASWSEQWEWAMALWEAVAKEPLAHYVPAAWRFEPVARVVAWQTGHARAELASLGRARERLAAGGRFPLLERWIAGTASETESSAQQHGHAADQPLSDDQRFALRRALGLREGDSLGIAGPPGAGTIALVRSLVASLVVDAVAGAAGPFDASPPLVVVAVPANETAATWLDAFPSDDDPTPSGRRWVAQTDGYAIALAAGERAGSSADRGYPTLHGNARGWESSATPPLAHAAELEQAYLETFARAYGRVAPSLDDAIAYLHAATRAWTARLAADSRAREGTAEAVATGVDRRAIRARVAAPLDAAADAAAAELAALDEARAQEHQQGADLLERLHAAVVALQPKTWYESSFAWLARVAQRRQQRFCAALGAAPPADRKSVESLRAWAEECKAVESARAIRALADRDAVARRLEAANAERASVLHAFDESAKQWDAIGDVAASLGVDAARWSANGEAPDELFDRVHRREAFRCAARYWEGRRLRELTQPQTAPGAAAQTERAVAELRSVAMLYPVAVATLPALASFYAPDGEDAPLYGALDALVVVDAERVDVMRGAAVLPPAKRLIALGDPFGRAPSIQLSEARSRAHFEARLGEFTAWPHFVERGFISYDRCPGALLQAPPARVELTGERNCAPEIVACCDELAYHGLRAVRQTPLRGNWPALGYAQIRGRCEQRGASLVNEPEARNLVQFVIERREELLRTALEAKCLADVVAILSPFAAQAAYIAERLADALRACRMRAEPDLAIGTPFALHAPVPVVLYSHVLGPGDECALVDARPNLLSLALWTATDHFLFFGDASRLAHRPPGSPSAVLAKHLLANPANRLAGLPTSFYGADVELAAVDTPADHRALFENALTNAAERLLIVSPLDERGLADATRQRLVELARRGVRVRIFSDREPPGGCAALREDGVEWSVLEPLLASALVHDEDELYEGSFRWLAAEDEPGAANAGSGWLARGPGAARAVDELCRYYERS